MTDRERLKDRLAAGCLVGSAVALLAADVISPVMSSSNARQLAIVGAQGTRQYVSAVLALVALALLIPGGLGAAGKLRARWARYGIPGGALLVTGVVATATATALALVEWRAAQPGFDRAQMTALLDNLMASTPIAVVFIAGIGVPLGLGVIAVGLARDRVTSPVVAAGLVAGPALVDAGFTVNNLPTAIVGSGVMVVGFVAVARSVFWRPRPTASSGEIQAQQA